MIGFTTFTERDKKTGAKRQVADRAWNLETDEPVVLPAETPQALGARYNEDLQLWVLT